MVIVHEPFNIFNDAFSFICLDDETLDGNKKDVKEVGKEIKAEKRKHKEYIAASGILRLNLDESVFSE